MQETNAMSIEYFKDKGRVADLLNGVIFQGRQIIAAENLQYENPVIHNISKRGNKISSVENTVDFSVMVSVEKLKFLLMVQIQTLEHYAMPIRIFHEKGTDYYNQWKGIHKKHKECKDLKPGAEFLSGMKKCDCIYPVLHITIYLGQKCWQAAKKMDELTRVKDFPEELQKLFAEKPLLLFEVYHFKNIEWFQTDLQQLCGFLQRTDDKAALQKYVEEHEKVFSQLEEDTYDLLAAMSGIRTMKLIKKDVENAEGGFDMCKAFDDMMRDSRREGKLEGEQHGLRMGVEKGQEQMGKLNQKLISAGRINDLLLASGDRKYREKLMGEFGIA